MRSKFIEVQCAFAVAEVRKVTANLSQTCGFAVAEHLLQLCGICGCGIECKFAVASSGQNMQACQQAYGTGSNDQIMIVFANVPTSIYLV